MEALDNVVATISNLQSQVAALQKALRSLASETKKLKKHMKKPRSERKRNGEPSGFNKPGAVSKELGKFLGLAANEEISRTEVTKKISQYIKDKKLQDSNNKKEFLVDDKLAKLFKIDKGTSVKYFGVQSHLKTHYISKPKA